MQNSKQIGIIGGSGIYKLDGIELVEELSIETPFGEHSQPLARCRFQDVEFFFLPRHGKDHNLLPHELNYQANIYALKSVGVEYLISFSAVGSLQKDLKPQDFVLPDQFIDWTHGTRKNSFFEKGIVAHVSCADPIDHKLQSMIYQKAQEIDLTVHKGGTYICIEGPRFSTRAESKLYRQLEASVVGMTNVPEAFLAKEAGMAYASVGMVTDYDSWLEEACNVEEIMKRAAVNRTHSQLLIHTLIPYLNKNRFDVKKENQAGLMSDIKKLSLEQQEIVKTLMK